MKITQTMGLRRPNAIRLLTRRLNPFALIAVMILFMMAMSSCIEDGTTSSPADQPQFSTQELDLGTVFTATPSATYHFIVYNRCDKVLPISSITLREGDASAFRLNVDGESARRFHGIEIRPNDSIYVFVETTVPAKGSATDYAPFEVVDHVDFVTNGVTSSVRLKARGQDVEEIPASTISSDLRWSGHPRRVKGTLTIAPGVSLTIDKGVSVYFHKDASLRVEGSLTTLGAPDTEAEAGMVTFRGDRLDNVVGNQGYDLLAAQWQGIDVAPTGSVALSHTDMRGTVYGLRAAGEGGKMPSVELLNCRLHRSAENALTVTDTRLTAIGTELSDSKGALLALAGGEASLTNCSLINFYISSIAVGPLLTVADSETMKVKATIDNSLLLNYRNTLYVYPGDLTGLDVKLRSTLIATAGSDDANFIDCIWGVVPLTRENHAADLYDYRLQPGSPGIGAGNPALLVAAGAKDMYGVIRSTTAPTVGAYEME